MANKSSFVKVVLNLVRFSHTHVFEKHAFDDKDDPKYRVVAIIDKDDVKVVKTVESAIAQCMAENIQGVFGGTKPVGWDSPLHDGDDPKKNKKEDPNLNGCYYMNTKSDTKPKVVTSHDRVNPVNDPDVFYAGCYGAISLTFFAYNTAGKEGIGVWVNSIMKIREGERLGNLSDPEADFADVELPEDEDFDPNSLM
jgi:hypothetical protein